MAKYYMDIFKEIPNRILTYSDRYVQQIDVLPDREKTPVILADDTLVIGNKIVKSLEYEMIVQFYVLRDGKIAIITGTPRLKLYDPVTDTILWTNTVIEKIVGQMPRTRARRKKGKLVGGHNSEALVGITGRNQVAFVNKDTGTVTGIAELYVVVYGYDTFIIDIPSPTVIKSTVYVPYEGGIALVTNDLKTRTNPVSRLMAFTVFSNGNYIALDRETRKLMLYTQNGSIIKTISSGIYFNFCKAFPDDKRLMTLSNHRRDIMIWDIDSARVLQTIKTSQPVTAVKIISNNVFIVGTQNGEIHVYKLHTIRDKMIEWRHALKEATRGSTEPSGIIRYREVIARGRERAATEAAPTPTPRRG